MNLVKISPFQSIAKWLIVNIYPSSFALFIHSFSFLFSLFLVLAFFLLLPYHLISLTFHPPLSPPFLCCLVLHTLLCLLYSVSSSSFFSSCSSSIPSLSCLLIRGPSSEAGFWPFIYLYQLCFKYSSVCKISKQFR